MNSTGELRMICYTCVVAAFLTAGVCEVVEGHYRLGVVSGLLGVVQALIFLVGRE
jgi:hypothetical protein